MGAKKKTSKINWLHFTNLNVAKGYSRGYTVDRFVYNIVPNQKQQDLETIRSTMSSWYTRTEKKNTNGGIALES